MKTKKIVYAERQEGSIANICFSPYKASDRYLSIKFEDNFIVLNSTDEPVEGEFCTRLNKGRAPVPKGIIEGYKNFVSEHPCDAGKKNVKVYMKKKGDFQFSFPWGTTYSVECEPDTDFIKEQESFVAEHKVNFTTKKDEYWNVTMFMSEEKKYCVVQKSSEALFPDVSELRKFFGRSLSIFYQGVMRYSTKTFVLPKAFYSASQANNYIVRGSKKEGAYIIAPDVGNCIIDDAFIDASVFSGKQVNLCEDCMKLPLDEAKAVIMDLLKGAMEIQKENEELKKCKRQLAHLIEENKLLAEENKNLRKAHNEAVQAFLDTVSDF